MELFIPLIIGAFLALLFFRLAKRKNRNGNLWGALTGGSFAAFIFLAICIPSFLSPEASKATSIILGVVVYALIAVFIVSAVILSFLSPICSKCKKKLSRKEWKEKICPDCGPLELG